MSNKYRDPSSIEMVPWPEQYNGIRRRTAFSANVRRTFPSMENKRDNYIGFNSRVTVADLIAYLEHVAPGRSYDEFLISFGGIRWTEDLTNEEIVERDKSRAKNAEIARKSRLDWFERLKAEFEPDEGADNDQ